MTISPRPGPSENPHNERITAGEVPGSEPPQPLLRVVPTQFDGQAILALVGELDTSNTATVREANVEFRIVAPPTWFRRALTAIQARDLLAFISDPN